MPAKVNLPEYEIVDRWLNDLATNTRALGTYYGCSSTNIRNILRRHLDVNIIDQIKRAKLAYSTANRPDLHTEEHRYKLSEASNSVRPENKKKGFIAAARVSASKRKGQKLSITHREALSRSHLGKQVGPNHPAWKGGTSRVCWRGSNWRAIRNAVRQRDNNTCQSCGKTAQQQGRNMDVHHRVSYFSFDDSAQANELTNLVCLCRSCHRSVENGKLACP